jgi:hypothetical protein
VLSRICSAGGGAALRWRAGGHGELGGGMQSVQVRCAVRWRRSAVQEAAAAAAALAALAGGASWCVSLAVLTVNVRVLVWRWAQVQ